MLVVSFSGTETFYNVPKVSKAIQNRDGNPGGYEEL